MKQLTIFEETFAYEDPLYRSIDSLKVSEVIIIKANGKPIRIELIKRYSNVPIYEYETDQEHGLAKGIEEIYVTLKTIIDEEFNNQLI
ncbi:hypothetical protein P9265_14980 [Schinkia azotoformans]|uniref:hypothetical protein n=1 Tax=Schinkia azotoformans TaxID=1454 RepID=UPI002E1CE23E|nr:hypothetical protein [Schinkia azotoformans]